MALDDWDCYERRMTHAFRDWNCSAHELKSYFDFTYSTCDAQYERTWDRAGSESAGTEYDQYEVFEFLTDTLPVDTQWTLRSSVIKDAVSAFEAYVEKAVNEARRVNGKDELPADVRWGDVLQAYDALGAEYVRRGAPVDFATPVVQTPGVKYVRTLRHVLTHRRGKLRSDVDRRVLADIAGRTEDDRVHLTHELVYTTLGELDAAAYRLDPLAWHLAGERRFLSAEPLGLPSRGQP